MSKLANIGWDDWIAFIARFLTDFAGHAYILVIVGVVVLLVFAASPSLKKRMRYLLRAMSALLIVTSTRFDDDESDLLSYGLRNYSPSVGRWLSRDPIAERGGANLYSFVSNDPIIAVDPFGLDFWEDPLSPIYCPICGGAELGPGTTPITSHIPHDFPDFWTHAGPSIDFGPYIQPGGPIYIYPNAYSIVPNSTAFDVTA
jgi:RHS repeat-associated protein